jgi:hypothetical protein
MFIREKVKKVNGQVYTQHQLLKSIRTPSGPRSQVVLNLGHLEVPKEKWKALADAIERKLNNQQELVFFKEDEAIDQLSGHYAQIIVRNEMNAIRNFKESKKAVWNEGFLGQEELFKKEEEEEEKEEEILPDFERLDMNSLKTTESRSIGGEYLILDQMKKFKFDQVLEDIGMSDKEKAYAKMLLVGRAVHPSSERELARWINENSGIQELIGSQLRVYDNALHRVSVCLWENRKYLEKNLRQKAKELFDLKEDIFL